MDTETRYLICIMHLLKLLRDKFNCSMRVDALQVSLRYFNSNTEKTSQRKQIVEGNSICLFVFKPTEQTRESQGKKNTLLKKCFE